MKILVYVLPNSSKTEELGMIDLSPDNIFYANYKQAIKLKLKSKPVDNAANKEVIAYFSKKYSVAKSKVLILKGDKSRYKLVQIDD